MEVTLIRHGESLANVGETDDLDSALTQRGEKQAVATGARLARDIEATGPFDFALVSPFRRTLMTYERINAAIKTPAFVYHDVCEFLSSDDRRYASFKGLSPDELRIEFPWVRINPELEPALGWWPCNLETRSQIYERAVRVRAVLLEKYANARKVIIVSHAETIGRLVEAFRLDRPSPNPPWTDNCSLWRFAVDAPETAARILLANDTTHHQELVR